MSILDEVLMEEYERNKRIQRVYLDRLQNLPKGYLSRKKIGGKEYVYLQRREGGKIISQYVKSECVEEMQKQIVARRDYQRALRELEKDQKKIERAVGSLVEG